MRSSFSVPQVGGGYPDHVGVPRDAMNELLQACDIVSGASPFGRAWFLNGNGSRAGNGTRDNPFLTMAAALAAASSGDAIYFKGNITENIVAPAGLFNISIIGAGTRPRHADAHTSSNGYSGATWKALVQTEPLIQLRQQGWRLANILFDCPTTDGAIELIRDAAAGDLERDSSHTEIVGNRFASGETGILISGTEIIHNVLVAGNIFNDLTHAIKTSIVADYGRRWEIVNNVFMKNTNHLVAGLYESVIQDNMFGNFTTLGLDLRGGAGGLNVITKNYLTGTYSNVGGYYRSAATDEWAGNFNTLAGGITVADPA